jgi:cell shape-determining protein MreC
MKASGSDPNDAIAVRIAALDASIAEDLKQAEQLKQQAEQLKQKSLRIRASLADTEGLKAQLDALRGKKPSDNIPALDQFLSEREK